MPIAYRWTLIIANYKWSKYCQNVNVHIFVTPKYLSQMVKTLIFANYQWSKQCQMPMLKNSYYQLLIINDQNIYYCQLIKTLPNADVHLSRGQQELTTGWEAHRLNLNRILDFSSHLSSGLPRSHHRWELLEHRLSWVKLGFRFTNPPRLERVQNLHKSIHCFRYCVCLLSPSEWIGKTKGWLEGRSNCGEGWSIFSSPR